MAWLLIAVVVGAGGCALLFLRQRTRTPRTVEDSIDRFARARSALAPDARPLLTRPVGDAIRPDQRRRHSVPLSDHSDDRTQRASDVRAE